MPGEVAAVHAGNIEGQQWFERAGFIPVIKMAAMPFEPLHGGESGLRPFNQTDQRKITEIARGQIGEQRQAEVRGRGAPGDRRAGIS